MSQVKHLQLGFEAFNLLHIPRNGNMHADSLATLATSLVQNLPRVILVENLCKPTEVKKDVIHIHQIRVGPSWMDSIVLFLKEDILPEEKLKADKVRRKGFSVLAVWGPKVVQALFLWAILTMHTP